MKKIFSALLVPVMLLVLCCCCGEKRSATVTVRLN